MLLDLPLEILKLIIQLFQTNDLFAFRLVSRRITIISIEEIKRRLWFMHSVYVCMENQQLVQNPPLIWLKIHRKTGFILIDYSNYYGLLPYYCNETMLTNKELIYDIKYDIIESTTHIIVVQADLTKKSVTTGTQILGEVGKDRKNNISVKLFGQTICVGNCKFQILCLIKKNC
jgi:F-box domain